MENVWVLRMGQLDMNKVLNTLAAWTISSQPYYNIQPSVKGTGGVPSIGWGMRTTNKIIGVLLFRIHSIQLHKIPGIPHKSFLFLLKMFLNDFYNNFHLSSSTKPKLCQKQICIYINIHSESLDQVDLHSKILVKLLLNRA